MKRRLKDFMVKLFALAIAIVMSIPASAFAQVLEKTDKSYTEDSSVMGLQDPVNGSNTDPITSTGPVLIKSDITTEETTDYIIEKSASLSKATGLINFRIAVKAKAPNKDTDSKLSAIFAINENTDIKDIELTKLTSLDASNKEAEIEANKATPGILGNNDSLDTLALTTEKPAYGMVYYLSAEVDDKAMADLDEQSPALSLDIALKEKEDSIYNNRYSLKYNNQEESQEEGRTVELDRIESLEEVEANHLIKGQYKKESTGLFTKEAAQITWTDYILSKDDAEFAYNFDLDQAQSTDNSQILVEFFEAKDKGYIQNKSFTQKLPFAESINLQVPAGQIAKISLTSLVADDKAKEFTFNDKTIANPAYKEKAKSDKLSKSESGLNSSTNIITGQSDQDFSANSNTEKEESSHTDSLKNKSGLNSSNNIITGQSDQDFSADSKDKKESPTTHTLSNEKTGTDSFKNIIANKDDQDFSAISLNKDSLISTLTEDKTLTEEKKQAIILYTNSLEAYNDGQITKEALIDELKATSTYSNLSKDDAKDILQGLVAGLDKEIHKVANLAPEELTNNIYPLDRQKAKPQVLGPEAIIPSDYLNRLVSEKLQEEGITIEDFQNYMYELEEKYNLTNEEVDRIYTDNEEAIQALVTKSQEEKTTGDVFAVDNQSAFRKTYPYKANYWTYQYYKDGKVNWDIRIETDQIKPSHLEFDNLGLSLYAPAAQGLTNFKVTVKDNLSDVSTNDNAKKVRERSGNGTTTFADSTLEKDGNLYKFNLNIPKRELPNDLIIHVEATPKEDHAKYQMYDLGLRLTPDKNYIQTVYEEFKNDWAKLLAAMPWIIPFKSGDGQVVKFKDGFNLVDTRLPANAMLAVHQDDKYQAKSYTDKSRSVFGEFAEGNNIRWQISETLKLEDDDRFVSSGKLGDDIFATVFNANNNIGESISVEVLEPDNGNYRQILSGSYSSASAFRTALKSKQDTLIPGTVINYIFTKTAKDATSDSTATTTFTNRFDARSGQQTATLRKLNAEEQFDRYQVVVSDKSSQIMMVSENGEIVYCLNWGIKRPVTDKLIVDQKVIKDPDANKFGEYSGTKDLLNKQPRQNEDMLKDIKRAIYLIENTHYESEEDKYIVTQAVLYRIIDVYSANFYRSPDGKNLSRYENSPMDKSVYDKNGHHGSLLSSNDGGSLSERQYLTSKKEEGITKDYKKQVDDIFFDIPKTKTDKTFDYYISDKDLEDAVSTKIYPSFKGDKSVKKDVQSVGSFVAKNPVSLDKVDTNGRPIDGVEFRITNADTDITWKSGSKPNKIYLKPGEYTVSEINTPAGYTKLEDFTIQVTEEGNIIQRPWNYKKYSNADKYETLRGTAEFHDPYNDIKVSSDTNTYVDSNGDTKSLVEVKSYYEESGSYNGTRVKRTDLTLINKNKSGRLDVSKKLLAVDGDYHNLPGIEFELKKKFSLEPRKAKTDQNGIARFDNLPLNSEWTLKEIVPKDIVVDHGVTWQVKVDSSGNVTVIPSQIDDSISSFKDGVLTVKNEPISNGKFKIKKVDQDGKPLSNAGFTLYKSDKSTVVRSKNSREAEYFTDENGNLYYSNIPDGIYYLKETTPPEGYTRASTSEWTSISIRNSNVNIIDGDITPDKIDQYVRFGNADEKVSVKSIDGKESSLEVDKNGNVNISTLADGDYELSQKNNKITVHIKDGKLTRSYQGGFVTNNPDQPSTNDQSLVKVSADLTQALVRYPNDNKSNAYPSGGYIDISRWEDGTYKIEDEIAKELITVDVKDGKLANTPQRSDLYETVTTRNWKSDLDYQRDANYPDYMNMKDYVELTDYDSGELTSYILLKPDNKIAGGNGTDKNTIFNIMASNANIKSVEIFDIGGDYYKAGPNASMENQSMGSYINDYNMQGTNETRDRKDKTYITIDGQRRGSVYNTYSNSVKISIPASRFGEDWSYLIRVKSNIYNKDYGSTISHHWVTDNDTLGEAYLKKDFDVPAYKDLTETRKVATIIEDSKNLASNVINNIKDGLLGSLVQTAYAAETSDFSKVEISHTPNGASDYIEYTVVNVIDNVDVSFTKYSICKDSNGEDYTQILPGAEFKLQILKDNQFVDTDKTARSDSSGQVKFEGLTAGEYQLIETTVPDGYRNPGGPVKKFTVKMTENGLKAFVNGTEELIYSGNNANNYIYNERKGKGELKVTKKGETSELLNGAEFTLYRFEFKDSGDSIATITTGKDGEKGVAHFTELPYGKYWLVETKSPDGYIRNPEPRLITISHKYYVPETAGKDVSSQLTLNRDSDHLPSIRSSSGSEYVVYPNSAEGLKANLNYKVDQNANIQPGDYFYASTSDNLDIGGIFDDNSFAKAGGLDIVGSQGTIAKAKVETIDGKSYIKYMFTDYVSNRRLNDINLYIPMFVDRYKVRNSTGNTSIPLPIPLEVGIAIPGQTQNKEKHVLSDNIHVDYEDIYRNQPSANMVNSYTISVDSNGRFRTVVYINQNQRYTWNKNITFSPNQNVKDLTYRVYQANTRLPMSYGLNESELGNPINTFTKDALNAGYYDTIYIGPENQYNTNTYYVVIDGTIENTNFYEFRNRVTYNSYIDNCCNLETYRWENSTINCDLTYNPGNTTERTMPVEVTVPNSKNQVEYTKIEALPEEDAPKDGSQVTNNTDESINKIDGAKFELRKLDETTSKYEKVKGSDQESKDGGKLKWTGLDPGKYEVWETEAPRGYTKPQDPVSSFEVNENGEIINIKDNTTIIKNYKASLPSTGGAGTFIGFAIVGTAVMLAAIAYFGIYQNNKNRRRSNR